MKEGRLLLIVALVTMQLSGCISRYTSDNSSPYSRAHSSRERYGLATFGQDEFESSRELFHACLRDSLAYDRARLELDAERFALFQSAFPGYFPGYALDSSGQTDDHLLCLGMASGYDLARAAEIARGSGSYYGGGSYYRQWRTQ